MKKPIPKPEVKIPKWYLLSSRTKLKKELIQTLLKEYQEPIKLTPKQSFQPTEMDIKDYMNELQKLSLKQILQIQKIEEAKPKLSITDKVAKINKKKALLVTIYHKNGSRTHYVCARHTRVLKINEHKYMCPPNMGNFDNKYNMMSYSYYENNPFPIMYNNDYRSQTPEGITIPDGELLASTMEFEFAQKLTHSTMASKISIAVVFSILGFVCSAATLVICVKGFNII